MEKYQGYIKIIKLYMIFIIIYIVLFVLIGIFNYPLDGTGWGMLPIGFLLFSLRAFNTTYAAIKGYVYTRSYWKVNALVLVLNIVLQLVYLPFGAVIFISQLHDRS